VYEYDPELSYMTPFQTTGEQLLSSVIEVVKVCILRSRVAVESHPAAFVVEYVYCPDTS